jgi:predicted helicase
MQCKMEPEGFLDIDLIWCLRGKRTTWLTLQMHDASNLLKCTDTSFQKFEKLIEMCGTVRARLR